MPVSTQPLDPQSALGLTPEGIVVCRDKDHPRHTAFSASEAAGLIDLGGHLIDASADISCRYWKGIADHFIRCLCQLPEGDAALRQLPSPDSALLAEWTLHAPPMRGAEYLSPAVLLCLWERLAHWTRCELATGKSLAVFLAQQAPAWSRVGRVTMHLAEDKNDPECPFAFMASYASGISQAGRLTQVPLGRALQEYSGAKNKAALLKLLTPLHAAARNCPLMASLIESGDIFHPMAWTPPEAYEFLRAIPAYEDAGLLVRLPNWWQKRGKRPQVAAVIGEKKGGTVGLDALLDFKLQVVIDGKKLSAGEIKELLAGDDGLVMFRGQWIEVDREKLREALDHWKSVATQDGISFIEGMRLLAGAPRDLKDDRESEIHREWAFAVAGAELQETLHQLSAPASLPPPAALHASLRPYQKQGLDWLWFCASAGLGACLADDMGLGKTIQVLAALLRKKEHHPAAPPSLLVVPASLIGNWQREADKFAPSLRLLIVHRSSGDTAEPDAKKLAATDLVITTYGMAARIEWLAATRWGWVILDEAQAIKNHASQQSKAVRKLHASARIAMTGTPVENHLGDLWSLFDFINPGLLGGSSQFANFAKRLNDDRVDGYAPLRRLVSPYILRRLKTDKAILSDLPDKTEMKVFCGLAPAQAKLYQQSAESLAKALETSTGMERRGLVLAYLMRFKQICNHPDQLTRSGGYDPAHSAKFTRLAALCEEISSRGEKALVFTQFRELTDPLEAAMAKVFGRGGLILHGGTAIKQRQNLVNDFQRDDGPPFFVLSLKAGGTGLNLTAACHVIHFDRWWNPAVENQATDRAFRIGQKRNVLVHKFITSGTLEEKIDALITAKQDTADAILSGGAEKSLTEMNNRELLDFIRLDIKSASG
jgi:SNF2-related domain/SNF2 Helicase protein/Helicase conserved C-terminal domain